MWTSTTMSDVSGKRDTRPITRSTGKMPSHMIGKAEKMVYRLMVSIFDASVNPRRRKIQRLKIDCELTTALATSLLILITSRIPATTTCLRAMSAQGTDQKAISLS